MAEEKTGYKEALRRIEEARKTGAVHLELTRLKLDEVPSEIGKLTALTALDLENNQITTLPNEIGKLTALTYLDLSGNQITTLPNEITKLTALTYLHLDRNQITTLPKEIGKLTALTSLYLDRNQITTLPNEITKLTALTHLHLDRNQITTLPNEITKLNNIKRITLKGNPLTNPPLEIAEKGIEAIREYFEALEEEQLPLNELKIILVGNGNAGKTSLVKRLLGKTFDPNESQTHGINIRNSWLEHNDSKIKLHFWDFGGQVIMHATHQFFLSKRSLYVLVLDGRREEKIDYWLKHIESFGSDSPVLVVLNKIDENPSFDVNRSDLQLKYPAIQSFHRISCAKGTGIEDFTKGLRMTLAKMPLLQTTWPKSWLDVKDRLEERNDEFISYETYKHICQKENVKENAAQDTLVDFLHDLGVILHFRDFRLQDTHVLDPGWVTGAIYRIITSPEVIAAKGVLPLRRLDELLKPKKEDRYRYPRDKFPYIIELMQKFELCYPLDNETILLPSLLGIDKPEFSFEKDNALGFALEFDFLPRSLFPRFLVKVHPLIKEGLVWRDGALIENKAQGASALVKVAHEEQRIMILVNGADKKDYLAALVYLFRELTSSFAKLEMKEQIPLPREPGRFVYYDHLLDLERLGIKKTVFPGSKREYEIAPLLGRVQILQPSFEGRDLSLFEAATELLATFEEQPARTVISNLKAMRRLTKDEDLLEWAGDVIGTLKQVYDSDYSRPLKSHHKTDVAKLCKTAKIKSLTPFFQR